MIPPFHHLLVYISHHGLEKGSVLHTLWIGIIKIFLSWWQNDSAGEVFVLVFTKDFNIVAWCHINMLWLWFTEFLPQDQMRDLNPSLAA